MLSLEIVQLKAVSQFEPKAHACYVFSREKKKQRHQKCRVEETNPAAPSFALGFLFTSKHAFSRIQKMSSMHVPSSFIPHTPIAHKTTRTSYQLFFGDNPRPRAGSSASHMARMKMEGHTGRYNSLSRHAWTHRPTISTFSDLGKNFPSLSFNFAPFRRVGERS